MAGALPTPCWEPTAGRGFHPALSDGAGHCSPPRYSASDCFATFPFPRPDPRTVLPELEVIGEQLYTARAAFMVETDQGLTRTYNALKDPACDDLRILALRRQHEDMDRAVLAAYGWSDIVVPPFCPLNDANRAALQAFEDEVIDRLYVLNAERAHEEERLGLRSTKGGAKGKGAGKAPPRDGNGDEASDTPEDAAGAEASAHDLPGARPATRGSRPKKVATPGRKGSKPGAGGGQGDLF